VYFVLRGAGGFMQGYHFIVKVAHPGQLNAFNGIAGQYFQLQAANKGRLNAMVLKLFLTAHNNNAKAVDGSGLRIPEEF
jgi:hypothetical protein